MKILICGINFSPELIGIGRYSGELASWLAEQGDEVRVITAPPYYPDWRIWPGHRNYWSVERSGSNLQIFRCPIWVPRQPSGAKRIFHLVLFAISTIPAFLRNIFWRPDVVLVIEPPLTVAPISLFYSYITGAVGWLHIQDFEVDAAFDLGIVKGAFLKRFIFKLERLLLKRFDAVSSISKKMVERLYLKGVSTDKVFLFPNWTSFEGENFNQHPNSYIDEIKLEAGKVIVMYSGNMGGKQGLEILGHVALNLNRRDDIHFIFCGEGPTKAVLEEMCFGLRSVTFLGLQPAERLEEFLRFADIHLLPQRADAADLVMPSKLTGIMASGKPVVVGARLGTELYEVVVKVAECGIAVEPEDSDAMARAVADLADNLGLRERLGAKGRKFARDSLNKKTVLSEFRQMLDLRVNKHKN